MLQRDGPIRVRGSSVGAASPSFTKSPIGLAPCLLVSLVLLASGWFCHVEAQRAEMAATLCLRAMEAVRATRVLATQWSAEVERVRSAVDSNFDRLADFNGRVGRQVRIIHDSRSAMPDRSDETDKTLTSLVRRLMAREERIERFKSGFAIVRNSRRFIPRIAEQLAEAARDGEYVRVGATIRRILEMAQGFLEQPTGSLRQWMEQAMRMLVENADGTPLRTQAETLNKHVHALLRHHELMERHFEEIMRTDLEDQATRAVDLLNVDHQRSETKRRYFGYGFRVSLGLALIYWATLVVRWAGRRKKGKAASRASDVAPAEGFEAASRMPDAAPAEGFEAASRAPDAAPAERFPKPSDMGVAPAIAGDSGASLEGARSLEDAQGPGRLGGETRLKAEKEIQARPAQYPAGGSNSSLPEDAREDQAAVEGGRSGASTSPGVHKGPGEARIASLRNSLRKVVDIDGAIGAALVDVNDGRTLATAGGGEALDIEAAGTANLDVIRAKIDVLEQLGLDDGIEDILITLGRQYHLIRPLERNSVGLFLYVVFDRERGNLGMARHQLKGIEADSFGILPT